MLLSAVLGMVVMASARDLVTIFVALELLSIPAYLMATWRKRDLRSNEAGLKYYLMGVFASAVLLYGMSLLYGAAGSTMLTDIDAAVSGDGAPLAVVTLGVIFVVVGFGFKVSAFPFHTWAPDTLRGRAHPGDRVLVGGVEGGRFRGVAEPGVRRLLGTGGRVPAADVGRWPRRRCSAAT